MIMSKRTKYHNKKVYVNGIKFDSAKEAMRYRQLKMLEETGEIILLELQVPFELQEKYTINDRNVRAIKYVADFAYIDKNGKTHVEDVKGMRTEVYKLKKKLFEHKYNIEIEEV